MTVYLTNSFGWTFERSKLKKYQTFVLLEFQLLCMYGVLEKLKLTRNNYKTAVEICYRFFNELNKKIGIFVCFVERYLDSVKDYYACYKLYNLNISAYFPNLVKWFF